MIMQLLVIILAIIVITKPAGGAQHPVEALRADDWHTLPVRYAVLYDIIVSYSIAYVIIV